MAKKPKDIVIELKAIEKGPPYMTDQLRVVAENVREISEKLIDTPLFMRLFAEFGTGEFHLPNDRLSFPTMGGRLLDFGTVDVISDEKDMLTFKTSGLTIAKVPRWDTIVSERRVVRFRKKKR